MLNEDVNVSSWYTPRELLCMHVHRVLFLLLQHCRIDVNNNVKVADFGLTENIYTKSYFRQDTSDTSVRLPLKWMALESIKLRVFSEKTDVVGKCHLCKYMFSRFFHIYSPTCKFTC